MPRRSKPDPFLAQVGARIRAIRERKDTTLERLAYESDVGSKGYVSDIESGRASPSLATLRKIAEYLEVTVADLVAVEDRLTLALGEPGLRYEIAPKPRRRSRR